MKKLLTLAVISSLGISLSFAGTSKANDDINMNVVSYSIGYNAGKSFHSQDIAVDNAEFSKGFTAGLSAEKPAYSDQEMQTQMKAFQSSMIKKMLTKQKEEAKTNQQASAAFMEHVAKMKNVKKIEDGLYYQVIKQGNGPTPKATDTVEVQYKGMLTNGKVFDSSAQHGDKPAVFKVNQVIPGWTKTLEQMPTGSTWKVYIAPNLAYGEYAPPAIGPNQALVFEINLIDIKKTTDESEK